MSKIGKFLHKNSFEKKKTIVINTYSLFHRHQFGLIGKKSYFLNPMFLSGTKNMYLGEDVGFWDKARVELIEEWQGKRFSPKLVIGNHTNIGQDCHITVGESIVIDENVLITPRVTITDIDHETIDKEVPVLQQGLSTRPVHICEGAFIGTNAVILPGVTIGKHAVIGAGAIVTKDVPDYATVVGTPARIR